MWLGQILVVLLGLWGLAGCEAFDELNPPPQTSSLLIAGSSSFLPTTRALVSAYASQNPNLYAFVEGGGSTAGALTLRRGVIDVAALSRAIKDDEDREGIICQTVARNAVGIIVHPANPVTNLTPAQVLDIYVGALTNWQEVGGLFQPMTIISRTKQSTTKRAMEDLLMSGQDFTPAAREMESATELARAVAGDPLAIGYVSMADMTELPAELLSNFRLLTLSGVPLTKETVLSGRYPLTREFYYAMRMPLNEEVKKFMAFVNSPQGQNIMKAEGLLTLY